MRSVGTLSERSAFWPLLRRDEANCTEVIPCGYEPILRGYSWPEPNPQDLQPAPVMRI